MKYVFALQFLLAFPAYSQHIDFKGTDFSYADSIAIGYSVKGNLQPPKIARELTKGLEKDIDKYRVIFRWIAENIDYDVELYSEIVSRNNDGKRRPGRHGIWSRKLTRRYARNTVKRRMTICAGYSWLLETMCRAAGLSCVSVPGYARDEQSLIGVRTKPNHAWNAVKINNKWYLSDPTWASGYVSRDRLKFHRDFDETYFLVSPDDLIANHYPMDPEWSLLLNRPTLAEFVNAPIKTTAFIENKISNYGPAKGRIDLKMDSVFKFQFSINKELRLFHIERSILKNKQVISEILTDYPEKNREGYYESSVSFMEKGNYVLRIYMNGRLTFIYKVLVK